MASPDNEVRLANETDDVGDKIFHLQNALFILEGEGYRQYADEVRTEVNSLILNSTNEE